MFSFGDGRGCLDVDGRTGSSLVEAGCVCGGRSERDDDDDDDDDAAGDEDDGSEWVSVEEALEIV